MDECVQTLANLEESFHWLHLASSCMNLGKSWSGPKKDPLTPNASYNEAFHVLFGMHEIPHES